MERKDYFSRQSDVYAAFRPTYPENLYRFVFSHLGKTHSAWDCATGNGQVASYLATRFHRVYATDISEQQLKNAIHAPNIIYSISSAEQTDFRDHQFDLITVAQALHWFDLSKFYREVTRTCRPGGLLAVWGYALLNVEPAIDALFMNFYENTVGPYWDNARKHVENHYRDLEFPFEILAAPDFHMSVYWTRQHFTGYLRSWSATQKYTAHGHADPLPELDKQLAEYWPDREKKPVTFPVFLKLGRVH